MKIKYRLSAMLLVLCMLCGCGSETPNSATVSDQTAPAAAASGISGSTQHYEAPQIDPPEFNESKAEGKDGVFIDTSSVSKGYVAVSARSNSKLQFLVYYNNNTDYMQYILPNDGTPTYIGLTSGDGNYQFMIYQQTDGQSYVQLLAAEADVKMKDALQPFIRTCEYVPYDENSKCVKKAEELAASSETEADLISAVYDYVVDALTYDTAKAESQLSMYVPDPDETIRTGSGICWDYASLAAAMLRSQGIPAKLIRGDADGINHAWNMFYTEETGWVTVSFQVSGKHWNRLDLTFIDTGADDDFVSDDTNYTDLYIY